MYELFPVWIDYQWCCCEHSLASLCGNMSSFLLGRFLRVNLQGLGNFLFHLKKQPFSQSRYTIFIPARNFFKKGVVLLLSCKSSFCIPDTNPLSITHFANILSQSMTGFFHLLKLFVEARRFFFFNFFVPNFKPFILCWGIGDEWKSWLKAQHSENEDHGIWSHHFIGNRWGNSGNSVRLYFSGLQNHYRWWLQPWN